MTSREPRQPTHSLDGRRIVITGGTGFVGAALVRALEHVSCEIVLVSRQGQPALPRRGAAGISWHRADVRAAHAWSAFMPGTDIVFHLAGQTSAYVAAKDPAADSAANVAPVLHLLEWCERHGRHPSIVLAGTATQVGLTHATPTSDDAVDDPCTVYDIHKCVAEQYLRLFIRAGLVNGATLRLANVYGPGPASRSGDRGVINQFVRKALAGAPLTVYGTGEYVRDYVYVDDVASAFLAVATAPDALSGDHYLVGSGTGRTIHRAADIVSERAARLTGRRVAVTRVPPPATLLPIEQRDFVADTTRLQARTGWRPTVEFADGIDRTIAGTADVIVEHAT